MYSVKYSSNAECYQEKAQYLLNLILGTSPCTYAA